MSEKLEKKVLEHKHFNVFAWIVIAIGVILWLLVFFRAYSIARADQGVPVSGSPEMVKRALVINEALKDGESQYIYQSATGPAPMAVNQEQSR